MQSTSFLRFAKFAVLAWLAALALVLVFGLLAGQSAGGEVAMQMFVLTLPVSIAVGVALNAIGYSASSTYESVHILFVWLPFFIGGLAQARIIFFLISFWRKNS